MKRGFTLVELAIVIVIAGILAAVAIPIYQGIVEKSKWSEGKSCAGLIQAAMKVLKAENSGAIPTTISSGAITYADLDLESTEFAGSNFEATDYTLSALSNAAQATWSIQVVSSVSGGPTGTYTLNSAGDATDP